MWTRSPSTAPASTEASWSGSPTRTRRASGRTASSRRAIIGSDTIDDSSTTTTSWGSGLARSCLNRPLLPGMPAEQSVQGRSAAPRRPARGPPAASPAVASATASCSRAAALPVGAASAMVSRSPPTSRSAASSLATVVVFPVPGPPVDDRDVAQHGCRGGQALPIRSRFREQPLERSGQAWLVHSRAGQRAPSSTRDELLVGPVALQVEQGSRRGAGDGLRHRHARRPRGDGPGPQPATPAHPATAAQRSGIRCVRPASASGALTRPAAWAGRGSGPRRSPRPPKPWGHRSARCTPRPRGASARRVPLPAPPARRSVCRPDAHQRRGHVHVGQFKHARGVEGRQWADGQDGRRASCPPAVQQVRQVDDELSRWLPGEHAAGDAILGRGVRTGHPAQEQVEHAAEVAGRVVARAVATAGTGAARRVEQRLQRVVRPASSPRAGATAGSPMTRRLDPRLRGSRRRLRLVVHDQMPSAAGTSRPSASHPQHRVDAAGQVPAQPPSSRCPRRAAGRRRPAAGRRWQVVAQQARRARPGSGVPSAWLRRPSGARSPARAAGRRGGCRPALRPLGQRAQRSAQGGQDGGRPVVRQHAREGVAAQRVGASPRISSARSGARCPPPRGPVDQRPEGSPSGEVANGEERRSEPADGRYAESTRRPALAWCGPS